MDDLKGFLYRVVPVDPAIPPRTFASYEGVIAWTQSLPCRVSVSFTWRTNPALPQAIAHPGQQA